MRYAPLLLLLVLAGCASGAQDDNAPGVTLHLEQIESAQDAYLFGGAVNLQYVLTAANTTNQAVTLSRIEVRTIGSGAYSIRSTSTPVNLVLGAGQSKSIQLSLWGNARGGHLSAQEPITIRAAAYLSGPSGPFVRLFTEYITPR